MDLKNKKILLCISGGIAAYKCTFLVRLLSKAGATVQVILSPSASAFVTPLSLSVLSGNSVLSDFYDEKGNWNNHVHLALNADLIILAPATANTMAKIVQGICDNLLMSAILSAKCPVFIAPAMDLDMYKHESTQANLKWLENQGYHIIPPGNGPLASGLSGEGRMAEPEEILEILEIFLKQTESWRGINVLITAGPTFELIDPVRFIGNFSTGKMGLELAYACCRRGAKVTLVCGPISQTIKDLPGLNTIQVRTANEMLNECENYWPHSDIGILAAAVADYRPVQTQNKKIKSTESTIEIQLVKNPDIAATLGKNKKNGQLLAGFALETNNGEENALKKLQEKNLNYIFLNQPVPGISGFGSDTNEITAFKGSIKSGTFTQNSKKIIAGQILDLIQSDTEFKAQQ